MTFEVQETLQEAPVETKTVRRRNYPKKRKKARRTKESYRANSPEVLAKQLAGLATGRGRRGERKQKPIKAINEQLKEKSMDEFVDDPMGFIETHFFVIETRRPRVDYIR